MTDIIFYVFVVLWIIISTITHYYYNFKVKLYTDKRIVQLELSLEEYKEKWLKEIAIKHAALEQLKNYELGIMTGEEKYSYRQVCLENKRLYQKQQQLKLQLYNISSNKDAMTNLASQIEEWASELVDENKKLLNENLKLKGRNTKA